MNDLVRQALGTAVEWKSGPNMRIVQLVAPFGAEAEMLEQVAAANPALQLGGLDGFDS